MIKCDEFSCEYNYYGDCENDFVVMEEKRCQSYRLDESKCIECGWTLALIKQEHLCGDRFVEEDSYMCPNCKS